MFKYLLLSQAQRYTYTVTFLFLSNKVILLYSRCEKKGLIYIAITAPSSRQPSFYIKCTKSNIRLSCDI